MYVSIHASNCWIQMFTIVAKNKSGQLVSLLLDQGAPQFSEQNNTFIVFIVVLRTSQRVTSNG